MTDIFVNDRFHHFEEITLNWLIQDFGLGTLPLSPSSPPTHKLNEKSQ